MKTFVMTLVTVLLVAATGCFGGGGEGSELMGRLPQGYDVYFTFDPEVMDIAGILELLEKNLPEEALEELEDIDMEIDPFDWDDWKDGMGLRDGEIGIIALTEKDDLVAFFLPCNDGAELEDFIDDNDFGDTEYISYGDYTVMVVAWDDNDDLLDDLEDALEDASVGETIASDEEFIAMQEATSLNSPCISFMFSDNVTEFPIFGVFSTDDTESVLKITVITDNDEVELYSGMAGEGLQSTNIKFPENTMAAVRYAMDMEWISAEYDNLLGQGDNAGIEQIEAGLPFIGFKSLEEFVAIFQGDFCVALQKIELDEKSELETLEGTVAISLKDSEKFMSSLDMISAIAEAKREELDDVVVYKIRESEEDFCFFICNDVFYVTMNLDPEDVLDGISANDYFHGDVASSGFIGGAVDPQEIMDGIQAEEEVEEIITTLFEDRAVFSVTVDGQMFTSTTVAGPDVLKSLISLFAALDGFDEF